MKQCNCEGCELKTLFFENVSMMDIETMCSRKIEKSYRKGETIILEGEPLKNLPI
jgi:CRP/FNR family transcriptional regulator